MGNGSGPIRVLALAGSTRTDSFNKKLVKIAAEGARREGAEVTFVDLRDYPLPLFDQDMEAAGATPDAAVALKRQFIDHHGLLIASPEYNSSITGVLKNAIDWISRAAPGEPPLAAFTDKVVALMSASPGALGGLRGLVHARSIFSNLNSIVLPQQVAIMQAHQRFNADGQLSDEAQQRAVEALGARLVQVLQKLHA